MQHDFSDDSDDSYVFPLHKSHPVNSVYKELPSASVIVHGTAITALIDSGASVNLLDEQSTQETSTIETGYHNNKGIWHKGAA